MGTKIRPFNLHASVDSHVKGLIDSDYIQARQTAGTDSSSTQAMIDSNFANMANLDFPDNVKLTFGNDSDLSITHTGSFGFIDTNFVQVRSTGGSQVAAQFFPTSSQQLFHNNSKKFETTDSGTNVTGNIVSNIRSNPKGFSVTHTVDSSDNALLVGPINVDSGVTLTINGTLMVV